MKGLHRVFVGHARELHASGSVRNKPLCSAVANTSTKSEKVWSITVLGICVCNMIHSGNIKPITASHKWGDLGSVTQYSTAIMHSEVRTLNEWCQRTTSWRLYQQARVCSKTTASRPRQEIFVLEVENSPRGPHPYQQAALLVKLCG